MIIVAASLLLRPEYGIAMHNGNADERVAFFTELLAIVTTVLAAVSAGQIWFLFSADKTAKISADAAKKSADAAIAAQRPWLKGELEIADDLKDGAGNFVEMAFLLRIVNIGNSPATNIQSSIKMEYRESPFDLRRSRSHNAIKNVEDFGSALFPGERSEDKTTSYLSRRNLEKN